MCDWYIYIYICQRFYLHLTEIYGKFGSILYTSVASGKSHKSQRAKNLEFAPILKDPRNEKPDLPCLKALLSSCPLAIPNIKTPDVNARIGGRSLKKWHPQGQVNLASKGWFLNWIKAIFQALIQLKVFAATFCWRVSFPTVVFLHLGRHCNLKSPLNHPHLMFSMLRRNYSPEY